MGYYIIQVNFNRTPLHWFKWSLWSLAFISVLCALYFDRHSKLGFILDFNWCRTSSYLPGHHHRADHYLTESVNFLIAAKGQLYQGDWLVDVVMHRNGNDFHIFTELLATSSMNITTRVTAFVFAAVLEYALANFLSRQHKGMIEAIRRKRLDWKFFGRELDSEDSSEACLYGWLELTRNNHDTRY